MTEREAADVRHVMVKEGTPLAAKVVALLDRFFPRLAQRAAEQRAKMPAPRAKSMGDYIAERSRPERQNTPTRATRASEPLFRRAGFSKEPKDRVRQAPAPKQSMTDLIKKR